MIAETEGIIIFFAIAGFLMISITLGAWYRQRLILEEEAEIRNREKRAEKRAAALNRPPELETIEDSDQEEATGRGVPDIQVVEESDGEESEWDYSDVEEREGEGRDGEERRDGEEGDIADERRMEEGRGNLGDFVSDMETSGTGSGLDVL